MILTRKLVDLFADKSKLRHDRSNLPLFMKEDGILRIASPSGPGPKIQGNVLLDRTLTSPIQVRDCSSFKILPSAKLVFHLITLISLISDSHLLLALI